jgi:hypothetical protein
MPSDNEREELIKALETLLRRELDGGYAHKHRNNGYICDLDSVSTSRMVKW